MSSAKRFLKRVDWYLENVCPKRNTKIVKLQVADDDGKNSSMIIPCNFGFPAVLCAAKDLKFTGEITIIHEWYIPSFPLKTNYTFRNGKPVSYVSLNDFYTIYGEAFIQNRIPDRSHDYAMYLRKKEDIPVYEDKEICARCKGLCCKNMGCNLTPEDVEKHFGPITEETIIKLLKSGDWAMDWYDYYSNTELGVDYDRGFYLRARNKNDNRAIYPAWWGECKHLTENGCKFDFEHRPTGGKNLKPVESHKCAGKDKYFYATIWLPYRDILQKIFDENYGEL